LKSAKGASGILIELFNGKPQALLPEFACAFACAFGSPLNEKNQYTTKSTIRASVPYCNPSKICRAGLLLGSRPIF
jgi:hypothetical protein